MRRRGPQPDHRLPRGSTQRRETERLWDHLAIEHLRDPARPGWLLLTSDGACEPHKEAGHDLAGSMSRSIPRWITATKTAHRTGRKKLEADTTIAATMDVQMADQALAALVQ
ncbi:hypothetical protein AB0E62_35870 [Streptomyces sp. NPDC038707]|uniref:hypothetical protein n=1 Tax=unclassified Streptomyces TaxID=2593676 RepID=UPI00340E1F0D